MGTHRRHDQRPRRVGSSPERDLYDIIAYRPNGDPIRLVDRAVEVYQLGHGDRDVAARCGVHLDTIRGWHRDGAAVAADLTSGRRKWADLSRHERKVHDFSQQAAVAETEGKLYLRGLAERLARGGVERVIETVKVGTDKDGKEVVVERSTRTETTLPDGGMIRWLLSRRYRDEYGDRVSVEATGPDGGPIQVDTTSILDALLADLDQIGEATASSDAILDEGLNPTTNGHHTPSTTT